MIATGIENGTLTLEKTSTKKVKKIIKGLEADPDELMGNGVILYNEMPIMKKISSVEVSTNKLLTDNILKQLKKNGYNMTQHVYCFLN